MQTLITSLLCVFLLVGCSASISDKKIPSAAKQGCEEPTHLPDTGLTSLQIELLWGRDRTNLRLCGAKAAALIESLTGEKPVDTRSFDFPDQLSTKNNTSKGIK